MELHQSQDIGIFSGMFSRISERRTPGFEDCILFRRQHVPSKVSAFVLSESSHSQPGPCRLGAEEVTCFTIILVPGTDQVDTLPSLFRSIWTEWQIVSRVQLLKRHLVFFHGSSPQLPRVINVTQQHIRHDIICATISQRVRAPCRPQDIARPYPSIGVAEVGRLREEISSTLVYSSLLLWNASNVLSGFLAQCSNLTFGSFLCNWHANDVEFDYCWSVSSSQR